MSDFTFPANQNALAADLNRPKHTVEIESTEENPLKRDLDRPKHQATDEPEPIKQQQAEGPKAEKGATGPADGPAAGATGADKPNGPSSTRPGAYEKPLGNHAKTAGWALKGWDQLASRVLKFIAKDEFRDRWKLTPDEHKEILEWATESAQHYNITVDSPVYGLIYSIALIYSDKGLDAWEMRQKNEKIEKQEEEIRYWKAKAGEYDNFGPSEKEIDEFINRLRKSRQNSGKKEEPEQAEPARPQPKRNTSKQPRYYEAEEAELLEEEEEEGEEYYEVEEVQPPTAKRNQRPQPQNQQEPAEDEFNFEKQRDREFFSEKAEERHNSTAHSVENSTNGNNSTAGRNNFNAKERKKPTAITGFAIELDGDNIARGPDGKLEPFEPIKEDKRGRKTEVVRCPQSRKLFERFLGKDKIFFNNAAKSQYYYWLELEEEGREPKGGWPQWWNSG